MVLWVFIHHAFMLPMYRTYYHIYILLWVGILGKIMMPSLIFPLALILQYTSQASFVSNCHLKSPWTLFKFCIVLKWYESGPSHYEPPLPHPRPPYRNFQGPSYPWEAGSRLAPFVPIYPGGGPPSHFPFPITRSILVQGLSVSLTHTFRNTPSFSYL